MTTPESETLGRKLDDEKRRYDLIPWREFGLVADVLTYGAKKYSPGNWVHVPRAHGRYMAAAMRHLAARAEGQLVDEESGLPHLAHAVCSLLFAMHFDRGTVPSEVTP